jgi:hypothetical protein
MLPAPSIYLRPYVAETYVQLWWTPADVSGYVVGCLEYPDLSGLYPPSSYTAIIDVSAGTAYTFTLAQSDASGTGPTASFRTVTPGLVPSPPAVVVTADASGTGATVTWTPPSFDGFSPPLGYVVTSIPINGTAVTKRCSHAYDTGRGMVINTASWIGVQTVTDPGYSQMSLLSAPIVPGFIPSSISGLTLWLDAADLTQIYPRPALISTGQLINAWIDKAGLGNGVNTVNYGSPTEPTFRLAGYNTTYPSILYEGTAGFGSPPISLVNNMLTLFTVSQNAFTNVDVSNMRIFQNADATIGPVMDVSGGQCQYAIMNDTSSNAVFASNSLLNQPIISMSRMDLTTCVARLISPTGFTDISAARLNAIDLTTAANYLLGFGSHMNVSEVILYNAALSDAEISSVGAYLRDKWGAA